jgi:hypothetical protein
MDRVEHPFFHRSQFTKEISLNDYVSVNADKSGRYIMKRRFGQNPNQRQMESLSHEIKTLSFFSSICPEFSAAPGVLSKVIKDSALIEAPQHPHKYLLDDTTLFMPRVRDALTLNNIILTGRCSEYDALVGSMQLWLVFLCVGDSMEFNDLHTDNIMFSPSVTFYERLDGNLLEKSPQTTIIDTEMYKINDGKPNNVFFRKNMVVVSVMMFEMLQICKFKQTMLQQVLSDESKYFKVFPASFNTYDSVIDNLKNFFKAFKDNILDPLSREIETLEKVPNIYYPAIHEQHTPRLGHFAELSQSPYVTEAWKEARRKVIRDLMIRIDYLVNYRIIQLHMGENLRQYPTWKLDSRFKKDEHRAAKRVMHHI